MKTIPQIIQTSFTVRIPWDDYEQLCREVSEHIASIPGLVWKAWVKNADRREAGGVYLFEGKEAADAFLSGPVVSGLENNPAFAEVRIKRFDLLEEPSAVTRFEIPATA